MFPSSPGIPGFPGGPCFTHSIEPIITLDTWVFQQNVRLNWKTYSRSFRGWALGSETCLVTFYIQHRVIPEYVALRWKTFHLQEDLEGQESQEDPVNQRGKKANQQCRHHSKSEPRLSSSSLSLLRVLWGPLDQKSPADSNNTVSHRQDWQV